nr:MAG TPA: hypothetical protein [Caudoviricetes sp.]
MDNLNPSVLYNPKGAIQTAIAPTPITVSRNVSSPTHGNCTQPLPRHYSILVNNKQ